MTSWPVVTYRSTIKYFEIGACKDKTDIKPRSKCNVQFQKISMPTPWKVNGNSEGVGVSKAQLLNGKYGA